MPQNSVIQTTVSVVPTQAELDRLRDIGEKLMKLIDELSYIFPERRHILTQIEYAILTRQNVLAYGTYGTGKTDMVNTLFGCFTGANVFGTEFNKFMTEANVIGVPNVKEMRTSGRIHYDRENGILDADFAELDEFFDANEPLLRALLGILNERQFKRGRQMEWAKLHTAIASTNGDPEKLLKEQPKLGAVIDRFLFQCNVSYVKSSENRRRMYMKYLRGEKPSIQISMDDIKFISDTVVGSNQITDPAFVEVYDTLIETYRNASGGRVISDRRSCKLLQLVEANALLFGRYEVDYEDLMAVKWGLCVGGNDTQLETFEKIAQPIIAKAKENQKNNIDEVQVKLLGQLERRVPVIPGSPPTEEQLVNLARDLNKLRKEVDEVKPQLGSTQDKKRLILKTIDATSAKVLDLING